MKRIFTTAFFAAILIFTAGCASGGAEDNAASDVPSELVGQSFIYDELDYGEGTALYTLSFSEEGYALYKDGGSGIISSGAVAADGGELEFEDSALTGSYTGGAFEELAVSVSYDGREMDMEPATDTTEYVYIAYLGVYEGEYEGESAVLILERWFEYYIYSGGELYRGTYEIYEDGKAVFTPYEGDELSGTVSDYKFEFETSGGDTYFESAEPEASYDAAHAMGTYTLSKYANDVFTVRGVDGYLKCFGTLEESGSSGKAVYFPRKMTGDAESSDKFTIEYEIGDGILYFPETTPLLPRSGNIDDETGLGSYWNAGTKLEFIEKSEAVSDKAEGIEFVSETPQTKSGGSFPESFGGLDQVMPSVGTARPLVLLIDFPDYHRPRHVTAEDMEDSLFSLDNEDSLAAYYCRSSYGNLVIDGDVLGWYRMERDRDSYESDSEIMAEALNYYIGQGLDLTDYDSDGDGEVDSLYILWAGTLSSDGIWSAAYRSTWDASPSEWDCKVTGYIFVPGNTVYSSVPPLKCNLNSLIHESGHLLGLNDYYSYDTYSRSGGDDVYTGGALEGGLAGMDMMDANIGDHNIFSKWLLGWASPTVVEYGDIESLDGETYEIKPSSVTDDGIIIKLKDSDDMYTELLVIEAVSPVGNAAEYTRLTQGVVRIMHIDASVSEDSDEGNWRGFGFKCDNSYTTTKFISILEADGEDEFLNYIPVSGENKPSYSEADYFTEGSVISPNTYPNTNGYDALGNASVYSGLSIEVREIKEDGTAVIALSYEEKEESLELVSISPEPTCVPYEEGTKAITEPGTEEIVFTYSSELSEEESELSEIRLVSDQEDVEGVLVSISGNSLIISVEGGLEAGKAYTAVIPQGILKAEGDSEIINNSNGIYGFAVEG